MYQRMQKLSAVLVSLVMSASIFTATTFAQESVSKTHWAQEKMQRWSDLDIIKGSGSGDLRPDDSITRAEIATIINKVFGLISKSPTQFVDVKSSAWYADELLKAREAGYYKGYTGNLSNADSKITREDTAVMLSNVFCLDTENLDNSNVSFKDTANVSGYALAAVKKLSGKGIIKGYSDGNFLPKSKITRAEFISVIDNLVKLLCNASGTYGPKDVSGHVIVNQPSVELKDMTINGNLYLTEGIDDGSVTLNNVTVSEMTYISGCKDNIKIIDTELNLVIVNVKNTTANLILSGTSKVANIYINSPTQIQVENGAKASFEINSDGVAINGQTVIRGIAIVENGKISQNISETEPEVPAFVPSSTSSATPTFAPSSKSGSSSSGNSGENKTSKPIVTPTSTFTSTSIPTSTLTSTPTPISTSASITTPTSTSTSTSATTPTLTVTATPTYTNVPTPTPLPTETTIPLNIVSIAVIDDISVEIGCNPVLPETVTATYDDGSQKKVAVMWPTIDTSKSGEQTIEGTITGTTLKAKVKIMVLEELILESVTVDNLMEVVLNFNRPLINTYEAEDEKNYAVGDDYFTQDNYYTYHNYVVNAELSSDKTTVTLLLGKALVQRDDIVVTIQSEVGLIEDTEAAIDYLEDIAAPTVVEVTAVGNSLVKVTFSEPVQYSTLLSNYTIDDDSFASSQPVLSYNGKTVSFYLSKRLSLGTHKLAVSNEVSDYAFFGVEANLLEFTVIKDKTKPTGVIESATQTKVVIKFSEEVEFTDLDNISTVSNAEIEGIEMDGDDMTFTIYFSAEAPFEGGLITIKNLTDLSGNTVDFQINALPTDLF